MALDPLGLDLVRGQGVRGYHSTLASVVELVVSVVGDSLLVLGVCGYDGLLLCRDCVDELPQLLVDA